jgi:AMP deaminase
MTSEQSPELSDILELLRKCVELRDKYITVSNQRLGDDPRDHDGVSLGIPEGISDVMGVRPEAATSPFESTAEQFKPWRIYPRPPPPHWHWTADQAVSSGTASPHDVFDFSQFDIPGAHEWEFEIDDKGIYQIYHDANGRPFPFSWLLSLLSYRVAGNKKPIFDIPSIREYFMDLDFVLGVISAGPAKSFAFRRLQYLRSKFTMYSLLNEFQEMTEMKVRSSVLDLVRRFPESACSAFLIGKGEKTLASAHSLTIP